MELNAIHHIAIIVSDYAAARSFYVDKLGFPVLRENCRPEKRDRKLDLKLNDDTELEIFAPESPPKRPSYPEACGLRPAAPGLSRFGYRADRRGALRSRHCL